jgi:hypothetical protein
MMAKVSFPVPNLYDGLQYQPSLPSKAYTMVNDDIVHKALFCQSNKKVLDQDSLGILIIKALMGWDPQQIMALVKQCLSLGYHLVDWKVAKGVYILKPGKKNYD